MRSDIEEVTKPRIGRWYWVPAVKLFTLIDGVEIRSGWGTYRPGDYVPILGHIHEDHDLVPGLKEHFHFDWRFIKQTTIKYFLGRPSFVLLENRERIARKILSRVLVGTADIVPERRRMQYLRPHPTFPATAPFRSKLEVKYAGAKAKCMICPHRGMPLAGAPIRDGAYVCPGHGLAFDVATLEMKPRQ